MQQPEWFSGSQEFGHPAADRVEPLFWIEELRFLSALSPDESALVRRVKFKKGLNVVWAKAPTQDLPDAKQRISGHAAGKTTLCRFIRFVFDEKHCADGAVAQSISDKFPNGYVTALVHLDGKPWVVVRSINGLNGSFCAEECSIDDVLADARLHQPYQEYASALKELRKRITGITLLPDDTPLTFGHILPWLTRDQDCFFSDPAVWRNNPVTNSDSPYLSKEKAMLVMRSVAAPGTEDEVALVKEQRQLTDKLDFIEAQQHDADVVLGVYKRNLECMAKERDLDVNLVEAWLPKIELELNAVLAGDGVTDKEKAALEEAEQQRDLSAKKCAVLADQISGSEAAYHHTLDKIVELKKAGRRKELADEIEEAAREHPRRAYCCQPIEVAKLECPLFKQAEVDTESASALYHATEPEGLLASLEKAVKIHEGVLTRERAKLKTEEKNLLTAKQLCNTMKLAQAAKRRKHVRTASQFSVSLATINGFCDTQKEQARLANTYTEFQKKHKLCSESLSAKRDKDKAMFARLTDVFNQLIGFVLGEDVAGTVTVSGGMIALRCSYKGDLESSAIRAVQTVCFDLATLVLSIEGTGKHPRFLLHDSPRVADLTGAIFHRYFWLAKKLEELANEKPTFQYIITTTEPPPKIFQDEPWLVAQLDASTKEGRLLHENL